MTITLYKWTLERYHRAIASGLFEDQALELLNGDLVVMSPERERHACYSSQGAEYLRQVFGDRVSIRETKPVTLPNNSEPLPDVAIVRPPLRRYLDHHPYPKDIFVLIEYSDTTLAKDLGEKKQIYAQSGIQEYWVSASGHECDLQNQQLYVFCNLAKGDYQTTLQLSQGTVSPQSFPDISIDIRRLLS